jgi:hypothetical protein
MLTTNETHAPAHILCPDCHGVGYIGTPQCCGMGSIMAGGKRVFECGGEGCTGAWEDRVKCESCNGNGVIK